MMIEQVRQATAAAHKELDESLKPVFEKLKNKDEYGRLLNAFYGFFAPVYQAIDKHLDRNYVTDYALRRRPESIVKDLQDLGLTLDAHSTQHLPEINNSAAAIGAYYVLEGSTMGGVFLSKMISDRLGLQAEDGLSFFYGYGKSSRVMWETFVQQLNTYAAVKGTDDTIIESAVDTFNAFKKHLDQTLQKGI